MYMEYSNLSNTQIMDYVLVNTNKWRYSNIWTAYLIDALVDKNVRLFSRLILQAIDTKLTVHEVDIYEQFFNHECDECLRNYGSDVRITFDPFRPYMIPCLVATYGHLLYMSYYRYIDIFYFSRVNKAYGYCAWINSDVPNKKTNLTDFYYYIRDHICSEKNPSDNSIRQLNVWVDIVSENYSLVNWCESMCIFDLIAEVILANIDDSFSNNDILQILLKFAWKCLPQDINLERVCFYTLTRNLRKNNYPFYTTHETLIFEKSRLKITYEFKKLLERIKKFNLLVSKPNIYSHLEFSNINWNTAMWYQ